MSALETIEWRVISQVPTIRQSEIHIWRINLTSLNDNETQLNDSFSDEECDRAQCFHFVKDRRRFVVRRMALRDLLGKYLGVRAKALRLLHTPHGKPVIEGQAGSAGIRFSCSHSADWALIAITRGLELGVDLEQHRPMSDLADLVNASFSDHEITEWMSIPEAFKIRCFFDGWSRKEAFVKAIGLGLSFSLKNFSVSLARNQPAKLLNVENDPEAVNHWKIQSLDVLPDYSGALVFEGENIQLQCFDWNSHRFA